MTETPGNKVLLKKMHPCGFAVAEVFEGMRKWPRGSPFLRAGAVKVI